MTAVSLTSLADTDFLIRLNRATAFEAVTASVIHDIRNPLQAVTMAAGTLAEAHDDEFVTQMSSLILQAAGQIENQLRRMVLGPLSPDGAPEPVSLSEVMTAIAQMQRNRPEKGDPAIEVRLPPDLPAVTAVEPQLRHALLNLVLNAREVLDGSDAGRLVVGAESRDDQVHLYVEDNGAGVPSDIALDIFDPFFTTKGGTHLGLGLPVAAHLAASWGGDLRLEAPSAQGGARFVLVLEARRRIATG